jgi:hypothetical protein
MVKTGGNGDANGIDVGEKVVIVLEEADSIFASSVESSFDVNVRDADQVYVFE